MKYYSEYSRKYVKDMCDALNEGGFKTIEGKPFVPEHISYLAELLEGYAVYHANTYDFLCRRGLLNTGRCPFTGETIDFSGPNYAFFDRKVYVSKKGLEIMQKESAEEYEKLMGHPRPTKPVKGGGCYIASVCFEDPNASEVNGLRIFRDRNLMRRPFGKLFVKFYYWTSPSVARILLKIPILKRIMKKFVLRKLINRIKKI